MTTATREEKPADHLKGLTQRANDLSLAKVWGSREQAKLRAAGWVVIQEKKKKTIEKKQKKEKRKREKRTSPGLAVSFNSKRIRRIRKKFLSDTQHTHRGSNQKRRKRNGFERMLPR
jgi:hypothetical protein